MAHPTDSKLLETARVKVVEAAKANGIELKQTYTKEGQRLGYKAGRYAHARQFKRMRKVIKRPRTIVERLQREVARKMNMLSQAVQETLGQTLGKAKRLVTQTASRKAVDNRAKLYSWHAPEVECISKVRREVANIIVSTAHKVGDETGRSVDRSLPVHALLATASCEATGTKCRALGPRRIPRGNGVTCEHQCGWDARLSGMVNKKKVNC
jgi:IS5 family transposase